MVQLTKWISRILPYLDPTRVFPAKLNGGTLGCVELGDILATRDVRRDKVVLRTDPLAQP